MSEPIDWLLTALDNLHQATGPWVDQWEKPGRYISPQAQALLGALVGFELAHPGGAAEIRKLEAQLDAATSELHVLRQSEALDLVRAQHVIDVLRAWRADYAAGAHSGAFISVSRLITAIDMYDRNTGTAHTSAATEQSKG